MKKNEKEISKKEAEEILSTIPWQHPGFFLHGNKYINIDDEKSIGGDLFQIKEKCKKAYNESPNVGSTINRFASWIWGDNSDIYSDYEQIQDFLDDFQHGWFNDLILGYSEYIINMLVDGEAFPLATVLNIKGDIRMRSIEDHSIRGGDHHDDGIITDPDDVTVTAFYILDEGKRLVPDINLFWDPGLYHKFKENKLISNFDEKIRKSLWQGKGRKKYTEKMGVPFKQFIIPWKNILGIKNLRRSVSSIRKVIFSDKTYDDMLKYTMEYFRAVMSFTDVFEFTPDRLGQQAFKVISNKMKTEAGRKELYNTGITKPKAPGDTLITMPGLIYKKVSPNLSTPMSGYFQDILQRTSAGLDTPSDMMSSNSGDATFASLKMSRQSPQLAVLFIRSRFQHYMSYSLMRSVFEIKSRLDPSFPRFLEINKAFTNLSTGKDEIKKKSLPIYHPDILKYSFPDVDLSNDEGKVKAAFGSKHIGAIDELGLSQEDQAKKLDINDLSRQKQKRMVEDEKYGKKEIIKDKESVSEKKGLEDRE